MPLMIKESFVNETKGYRFGDSEWTEAYTEDRGRLFREMRKEYGRCTSSVYVDLPGGGTEKVGWYFQKTMMYEDARSKADTYVRGVWVTLRFEHEIECPGCDYRYRSDNLDLECPLCGTGPHEIVDDQIQQVCPWCEGNIRERTFCVRCNRTGLITRKGILTENGKEGGNIFG